MSKELFLTGKEAVQLFKRAPHECKFAVKIVSDIYVPVGSEMQVHNGASSRYLTIARGQALKLVRGFINDEFEKVDGRIKVTELVWQNKNTIYWIG